MATTTAHDDDLRLQAVRALRRQLAVRRARQQQQRAALHRNLTASITTSSRHENRG